jgi:(p)ppGpp synthase/HD superfamily hydrolase
MDLERAIEIATAAHRGQTDKAGQPYILHPLRVMSACEGQAAQIAAVLHDVIEDTDWTPDALRAEGASDAILAALDAVTRRDDETYSEFIERAARNEIGRMVKIADLRDNLDLSRIAQPTKADFARMDRYRAALQHLGSQLSELADD